MRVQVAALLSCLALAACGGAATPDASADTSTSAPAATPPVTTPPVTTPPGGSPPVQPPPVVVPPAPPPPTSAPVGPPGTNLPSHNVGNAALQVGAGSGLYYVDQPQAGEAQIAGFVLVQDVRGPTPQPPPADVVVSINGVQLVRMVVNGMASDRFFVVDPAGPQPTIVNGFLDVTAASASLNVSRTLELACPDGVAVSSNPAEGASLAAASAISLAFGAHLPFNPPTNVTPGTFPGPTVSLYARDAATGAISASPIDTRPIDQGALGATLLVHPTAATGYLAELRFPGIVFLDNLTGGFCGRTTRLVFAN